MGIGSLPIAVRQHVRADGRSRDDERARHIAEQRRNRRAPREPYAHQHADRQRRQLIGRQKAHEQPRECHSRPIEPSTAPHRHDHGEREYQRDRRGQMVVERDDERHQERAECRRRDRIDPGKIAQR